MTKTYSAQTVGTFDNNIDKLAVEITAAANTTVKIKKVRVFHDDGTGLVTADYHKKVKLVRESAAGTGGGAYTPIKLDANAAASSSTVKTGVFTVGTVSDTVENLSVHNNTDFYWSAADEDDKIVIAPGGIFAVILNPT